MVVVVGVVVEEEEEIEQMRFSRWAGGGVGVLT
jgi:hypothetical protein